MTEIGDDDFDLDVLMRRIRSDVERRRATAGAVAIEPVAPIHVTAGGDCIDSVPPRLDLARLEEAVAPFTVKERYRVEEFLRFHDEQFIRNAYLGLLRREPDPSGLASFLQPLRGDELSKVEVLGRIRYSPEGRAVRVHVDGLATRFAARSARRIPVIGRLAAFLQYLVRLPELGANLDRLERAYFSRDLELRRAFDANSTRVEGAYVALAGQMVDRFSTLQGAASSMRNGIAAIETAVAAKAASVDLDGLSTSLDGKADATELDRVFATLTAKAEVVALAALEEAVAGAATLSVAERAKLQSLESRVTSRWNQVEFALTDLRDADASLRQWVDHAWSGTQGISDAFYADFERRFHGNRDERSSRMQMYVPLIVAAGAGTEQRPILDVGCGHGEWLELVRSRGLAAQGVDVNAAMVAGCVRCGLQAHEGNAVEYLRSLWASSVGAVTGFHLVEHLPFHELLALVDEAQRVLCPGGIVILESPDPEDPLVTDAAFYVDPTRRRPVPPALLQFVVEYCGFADVEVLRGPPTSSGISHDGGRPTASRASLYGIQAYAVVARRPAAASPV